MKKYILLLLALPLFLGCSNDDFRNTNRFIPDYNFDFAIDMNLPQYSNLLYVANPVPVYASGIGLNGVVVMNTGSGYVAFELTCPNQPVTECSELTLKGILAKCPCDDVEYSLFDGTPATKGAVKYGLKAYRVTVTSSTAIRISN
jgi:nitrite reductase/ring-hydroxylating ferredoxin subunit